MNISGLTMIFNKWEKKPSDTPRWQRASTEDSIQDTSEQFTTQAKVKTKTTILKGNRVTPNQQGLAEFLQTASPKKRKGTMKLRREIQQSAKKTILLISWRR
jgi:hypothetical protein